MKDYNRREFIKSGLLVTTSFFISPFEKLSAAGNSNRHENKVRQLQKQAKAFFYRKEYNRAEDIYRQLLALIPASILAYDGLAKTFYAQNNVLAAAECYRQGWLERPNHPLFCERLARAMQRLVTGNNKHAEEFCRQTGETELLEVAAGLYIQCIDRQNGQVPAYIQDGLLDVQLTLEKLNRHRNYTGHPLLEFPPAIRDQIFQISSQPTSDKWKESRRKKKKSEYVVTSETAIKKREDRSKNKYRRSLEFNSERENRELQQRKYGKQLYQAVMINAIESKSTARIEKYQQKIQLSDPSDTNAHGLLVRHYRHQKAYEKLTYYQKKRYIENPIFWNTISYAQALRLQARKESKTALYTEAENLYWQLLANVHPGSHEYICVYGGLIECQSGKGEYEKLRQITLEALKPYNLSYLPFILAYVRSWMDEGTYDLTFAACLALLEGIESPILYNDPIYDHLKIYNKAFVKTARISKEYLFDVYYITATLYEKQGKPELLKDIFNKITEIDHNNSFVNSRIVNL